MSIVTIDEIGNYLGSQSASTMSNRLELISNSVTADIESYIGYEIKANTHTDLINIEKAQDLDYRLNNIPLQKVYEVKINNTVLNDTAPSGQLIPNGDGTKFSTENNAELSKRKSKFGIGSVKLPQANSTITLDAPERMEIGDSSFTVEMWMNSTAFPTANVYSQESGSNNLKIRFESSGAGNQLKVITNNTERLSFAADFTTRSWNHVAVTKSYTENAGYLHLNGQLLGTIANFNTDFDFAGKITIGNFAGYVDEFRLSDTARYSNTNFDISTLDRNIPDENTLCLSHFDNGLEDATQLASSYCLHVYLDTVRVDKTKLNIGDAVQIRYRSGYDEVPEELKWAALELIRLISKNEEDAVELALGSERIRKQDQFDATVRYPRQVQRILDRYRK